MATDLGQLIKQFAKYLYKNIPGAYKINFGSMTSDVFTVVYYQVPGDAHSFKEMNIDISITGYANKIRINITQMDHLEKTIGQIIFNEDDLLDKERCKYRIIEKMRTALVKEYSEYDFVW